ncbi:MAG: bifunctional pyr operon transcriptional regulator/uracil phosphoribosyltransferase PyrR, partial [Phycisphaerae bacterium]
LDAHQTQEAIERLYQAILEGIPKRIRRIAVVGIRTRGESLAGRLVDRLSADRERLGVDVGVLDITFYRDDLSRRRGLPLVRATEIDFDIDDAWLLLVDDVLHTGRSIRAALDAVHDFGRPRVVRLGVLIDRGGRELPISADFVGHRMLVESGERVQVRLEENDGQEGVFLDKKE